MKPFIALSALSLYPTFRVYDSNQTAGCFTVEISGDEDNPEGDGTEYAAITIDREDAARLAAELRRALGVEG